MNTIKKIGLKQRLTKGGYHDRRKVTRLIYKEWNMEIKPGTLGIVFPKGGLPPALCWGKVLLIYPSGMLFVEMEHFLNENKVPLPNKLPIEADRFVPITQLEDSSKPPRTLVRKNVSAILLRVLAELFPARKLSNQFAVLKEDALVIVCKNKGEFIWGVVHKIMPDGGMDITLGRKRLIFRDKMFAKPEELTAVHETNGSLKYPLKVLAKYLDKILINVLLRLLEKSPST